MPTGEISILVSNDTQRLKYTKRGQTSNAQLQKWINKETLPHIQFKPRKGKSKRKRKIPDQGATMSSRSQAVGSSNRHVGGTTNKPIPSGVSGAFRSPTAYFLGASKTTTVDVSSEKGEGVLSMLCKVIRQGKRTTRYYCEENCVPPARYPNNECRWKWRADINGPSAICWIRANLVTDLDGAQLPQGAG